MARREDPKDIILVKNIDVDCKDVEQATVPVQRSVRIGDKVGTREVNMTVEINHAQWFEVRWNRKAYRIMAGKTRKMTRDIAEHFAKHLADHILMKEEMAAITEKDGIKVRPNFVRNPTKRTAVLKKILLGVEEWFMDTNLDYDHTDNSGNFEDYDSYAQEQLGTEEDGGMNLGIVTKPMMLGMENITLELPTLNADISDQEPVDTNSEPASGEEVQISPEELPKMEDLSKAQLLAQAQGLSLEVTGKESKPELLALIQSNT